MVSIAVAFRQNPAWEARLAEFRAWQLNVVEDVIRVRLNDLSQGRMLPQETIHDLKHFLELYRVYHCTELSA